MPMPVRCRRARDSVPLSTRLAPTAQSRARPLHARLGSRVAGLRGGAGALPGRGDGGEEGVGRQLGLGRVQRAAPREARPATALDRTARAARVPDLVRRIEQHPRQPDRVDRAVELGQVGRDRAGLPRDVRDRGRAPLVLKRVRARHPPGAAPNRAQHRGARGNQPPARVGDTRSTQHTARRGRGCARQRGLDGPKRCRSCCRTQARSRGSGLAAESWCPPGRATTAGLAPCAESWCAPRPGRQAAASSPGRPRSTSTTRRRRAMSCCSPGHRRAASPTTSLQSRFGHRHRGGHASISVR